MEYDGDKNCTGVPTLTMPTGSDGVVAEEEKDGVEAALSALLLHK